MSLFGSGFLDGSNQAGIDKPNIGLILADDVGREILRCFGGTSYQTPNIDALAQKGMRFEHVYSSPVCHPSRLSLLTGMYPFRLGNPEWVYSENRDGEIYWIRTKDRKPYSDGRLYHMKSDIDEINPILPEDDTSDAQRERVRMLHIMTKLRKP